MALDYAMYVRRLNRKFAGGDATEHTHRPALQQLLEEGFSGHSVVNEPKRRTDCGAPDLAVKHGETPIGHVETKDIGVRLDEAQKSEQLKRYRDSLANLILTDYLEFRWFTEGEHKLAARIGRVDKRGRIEFDPDGADDLTTLLGMFRDAAVPTVDNAKDLARRMAGLTRLIRHAIGEALTQERDEAAAGSKPVEDMPLHEQLAAFRGVLIHDLDEADFADMYAQTICYGLFAARFHKRPEEEFTREIASFRMPSTNPFLAKTFVRIGGADLDERLTWAVDDLAELLNRTDMNEIERQFRGATRRDDPVVHFYETFLSEYAPDIRERRGVYYTPGPVVSYIVRSIDALLKSKLGLPRGLADESKIALSPGAEPVHRVQILDPAAGTGTFLHGVIDLIYHGQFKGNEGLWPGYVRQHLLPRLHGFEILMAPYTVAHLKINRLLEETHVELHGGERVNIYLTNALEEAHGPEPVLPFAKWLTDEAREASRIKRDAPVMVVLGNPPYSGHSQNPSTRKRRVEPGDEYEKYSRTDPRPRIVKATRRSEVEERTFIGHLLRGWDPIAERRTGSYFEVDGQPLDERNPKWLNDDYVKFIRFAQWRIERTGQGILGFITNHGWIDNPTFRGMRQCLMGAFDEIYILDLHGSSKKKEVAPDGSKDENVFDIQQGVAISIFVRLPGHHARKAVVRHAELWGPR